MRQEITPERWQQIERLYHSALERDISQRAAFLQQGCAGDDALREEVESLLAREQTTDGLLGHSAQGEMTAEIFAKRDGRSLLGTKLGSYQVLTLLGSGGMGEVYQAHDSKLRRDVAIKVLPAAFMHDAERLARFEREARMLAALNHPNIATIYGLEHSDDVHFLVMELVPGQTLAQRIRGGRLPLEEALKICCQVAGALKAVHETGIIHRDLKPDNVKITPEGWVKVLDFGLAKAFANDSRHNLYLAPTLTMATEEGRILGTPLYMSPEQALGKTVDVRSDIWSLGVILYEMLSGGPPFRADSSLQVMHAITHETPVPLRELCPNITEGLDRVVGHALEKDVSRRYQCVSEMVSDLSLIMEKLRAAALPAAGRHPLVRPLYMAPVILVALLVVAGGVWSYQRSEKRHWAREQAIPQITKLTTEKQSLAAFLLLREVEKYLPADGQVVQLALETTRMISISSLPAGATVEIQDYLSPDGAWFRLGTTPLEKVRIPDGYLRWRISKQGTAEYVLAPVTTTEMTFQLDAAQKSPQGMVPVGGGHWSDYIASLGGTGPYDLPPYYIGRFEVTNRQYQDFVDSGGYQKPEYWKQKFIRDGHELNRDDAIALFRDSTGRPGPSTWEAGHYPEGQGDYPVSGVSWYEASAYAAFAGESLPTIVQWYQSARADLASYTVQESNFSLSGLAPVGKFNGVGPYGTYDMAGNVREWCENEVGNNLRFILGGAWNSPTYLYADPEALSPFDRSSTNGFRAVRNTGALPPEVRAPTALHVRDFSKAKAAPDEVFHAYQAMYDYDHTPLNANLEEDQEDSRDWRKLKVTFDAAYGGERVSAYLFLPKNVRPPFQTVMFFPSARVLNIPTSQNLGDMKFVDYVIQSGRAVMYPIYKGTYERGGGSSPAPGPGPMKEREVTIQRAKDLGRSVDYLETRADIDKNKLGYLGVSMGSAYGVIFASLEDRFKAVVFLDGGYFLMAMPPPGMDQVDFAPRLKKPVLMVNGRYDFSFSLKESQDPMFRMLGTQETDKRHVVLETPHDVTAQRPELIKEVLGWLDKYLGKID